MNKELILASLSPRRKEILKKAAYEFKIIPSKYDEKLCNKTFSKELVENCAYNKALDVFKNNNNSTVVAADTVVVAENIILGKPKNKEEAFWMLKKLSDKTHFVLTAVCILQKDKHLIGSEITYVTFRKLKDTEINNYINEKNPLDKAGSYGIQDKGFDFAIKVEGETDNVIGFPLKLFQKLYKSLNDS